MTPFSFVLLSFLSFFIKALALCVHLVLLLAEKRDGRRRIIYETAFIHKHTHTAEGKGREENKRNFFHRFHQRQPRRLCCCASSSVGCGEVELFSLSLSLQDYRRHVCVIFSFSPHLPPPPPPYHFYIMNICKEDEDEDCPRERNKKKKKKEKNKQTKSSVKLRLSRMRMMAFLFDDGWPVPPPLPPPSSSSSSLADADALSDRFSFTLSADRQSRKCVPSFFFSFLKRDSCTSF